MLLSRLVIASAATLAIGFAAESSLLKLGMDNPRVVAGLNVAKAKSSPFGQRILAEMRLEDASFQRFLAGTGFDPRRDLTEIVLMSDSTAQSSHGLIIARGNFDAARIAAFVAKEHPVPTENYRGVTVLLPPADDKGDMKGKAHQPPAFAVIDASTAVMGDAALVRKAIDNAKSHGAKLAPVMAKRVATWSANNHAWFVSDTPLAELGAGKPGRDALMPGGIAPEAIQKANAGVKFGTVIEVNGELTARSDKDAEALADVIRFVRSMVRLNAKTPEQSDLVKMADAIQVSTKATLVRFSLAVADEQVEKIFNNRPRHQVRNVNAPAR